MQDKSIKPKQGGTPKPAATKPALAEIRADYFGDRYFVLIIIALIIITICAGLVLWGLRERTIVPTPVAFATTVDGKLIQPTPLNLPGYTDAYVIEWAVQAVSKAFGFNFINYESVFTNATTYFTKLGFQDYRHILIDSGIVNVVQQRKYVVSVEPTSAPIILKQVVTPDNIFSWQLQFGILATFENVKESIKQEWIITMLIVRVPISDSPEGIGIAALIAREGKTGVT